MGDHQPTFYIVTGTEIGPIPESQDVYISTIPKKDYNYITDGLVYWGLTPQQQPGSYQGGEMMMKSVFWWRKPEYPEETTDLRQVTDETFHTYGLCPVRGLNLGRSGVKQSELRRDESGALAHRATAVRHSANLAGETLYNNNKF